MMTKEKAFAFVSGFDRETRTRWFALMLAYRWPSDLPFFANPLPYYTPFEYKTGRAVSYADRETIMRDPVWRSLRDALAATLPADVQDEMVLSSYLPRFADAVAEFHLAHTAYREANDAAARQIVKLGQVFARGMPENSR